MVGVECIQEIECRCSSGAASAGVRRRWLHGGSSQLDAGRGRRTPTAADSKPRWAPRAPPAHVQITHLTLRGGGGGGSVGHIDVLGLLVAHGACFACSRNESK